MTQNKYIEKIASTIEKNAGLVDAALSKGRALAGKAFSSLKNNATKLTGDIGNLGRATGVGGKTSVLKAIGKNPITMGVGGVAAGVAAKKILSKKKDNDQ